MKIRIEGLDAVQAALSQYAADIPTKLHKGLVLGTRIVQSEARVEAPVDTGALRRSIHGKVDGLTGVVGTNCEYAIYQEFGTYKMSEHPFLVPALKNKQSDVIAAIKERFMG